MKNIGVFTGTRAEYGLMKHLMKLINNSDEFNLKLIVAGTHLSSTYGNTIKEIQDDNFEVHEKIFLSLDTKFQNSMVYLASETMLGIEKAIHRLNPEIMIILGDRYEAFAAASASFLLGIPIVHLHGGETTLGAIDDNLRHAITQMSKWHFTAANKYQQKVIAMGIKPNNVFNAGPMIIDGLLSLGPAKKDIFEYETGFKFGERNILVTYHPETLLSDKGFSGFESLLKVIDSEDFNVLFTYPNADEGGKMFLERLKSFVCSNPKRFFVTPSLGQKKYLDALRLFDVMVGNSSSGIIEAPLLGIPVLNIGNRQSGRIRFGDVFDVPSESLAIKNTLRKILHDFSANNLPRSLPAYLESPSTKIFNWMKSQSLKGFS